MIKLYSLKQHKKDGESPKSGNQKKASAAHLRITKGNYNFIYLLICITIFSIKMIYFIIIRKFYHNSFLNCIVSIVLDLY